MHLFLTVCFLLLPLHAAATFPTRSPFFNFFGFPRFLFFCDRLHVTQLLNKSYSLLQSFFCFVLFYFFIFPTQSLLNVSPSFHLKHNRDGGNRRVGGKENVRGRVGILGRDYLTALFCVFVCVCGWWNFADV